MRKKKRVVIGSLALLILLLIFGISVFAKSEVSAFMSQWGKVLNQYAINNSDKKSKIYAKGNSAVITEEDVQQATDFFILSGLNGDEAKEKAIHYVEERNALYEEAIRNGYSVTDEEVRNYLKELKVTLENADNKEDYYAVLHSFGSEKEYWDYEFTVYQIDLPIQKLVDSLQTQYKAKVGKGQGVSEDGFRSYYERYKQNLVNQENYQLVK